MKISNHKRVLFTILFSLFTFLKFTNSAQALNLDSLWTIWNDKTQADTTRLKAMNKIAGDGYLYSQPDSAFYFAQMQYDLAEKKGLKKYMAMALSTQGVSFKNKSDYPKALDYYQRSLKIMEEIGYKKGISVALNNIGVIYHVQGDYTKVLDYFQRSLIIDEEIGDKIGLASGLNNIGSIYYNQGDYPKALDYQQKSLKISEEIVDKKGIAYSLNNIGLIYLDQGDYPKALDYCQRSLKIKEEIGDKKGSANGLNNIGLIYENQGDYPKALAYYKRSLKTSEEIGDKNGITGSLNSIGNLYQKQGDFQKAIKECSKGLLLAKEIEAVSLQRDACNCLYDAYKSIGNGNKALEYHEQMLALDDSLNAEETAKALQQMEFSKTMLKDSLANAEKARTEKTKTTNTRNILIGAALLFLLIAGGLFSRWRFTKKANKVITHEKDKSDNLLLNILPADIAKELKETGKAEARDFENVSIIFTDFKHFTQTSEKLSAKELVAEINTCFEAFDNICKTYEVEKIKTIGDAYMAASGLPVYTNDSTKNAIHAAIEMQAFITKRKQEKDSQGEPAFEMRVGIHTGNVVAGIVGKSKFQYDIWGDTVNTAARTESSGEVGKVNITQATYELIKDTSTPLGDPQFKFEHRGKIAAKGKGEIDMYFVS